MYCGRFWDCSTSWVLSRRKLWEGSLGHATKGGREGDLFWPLGRGKRETKCAGGVGGSGRGDWFHLCHSMTIGALCSPRLAGVHQWGARHGQLSQGVSSYCNFFKLRQKALKKMTLFF